MKINVAKPNWYFESYATYISPPKILLDVLRNPDYKTVLHIYLTFTIDIFRLRNVLMKSFLYVGENIIIFHAYSPISYCTNIKTAKELPSNGSVPKCYVFIAQIHPEINSLVYSILHTTMVLAPVYHILYIKSMYIMYWIFIRNA